MRTLRLAAVLAVTALLASTAALVGAATQSTPQAPLYAASKDTPDTATVAVDGATLTLAELRGLVKQKSTPDALGLVDSLRREIGLVRLELAAATEKHGACETQRSQQMRAAGSEAILLLKQDYERNNPTMVFDLETMTPKPRPKSGGD
jgi:hypothetical protein